MADVRMENVSKHYGKLKVLQNLTITIRDGECFTFLGPSGCGKTVVLRLIAGFERPDGGEIFIGDRLVSSAERRLHVPPEARKIGVVFQDYAVWPHKTVLENVMYPLTIQGISREEATKRTMEAIEHVNLQGLEGRLPFQLSGGQQQRVALARALVSRPESMLLDEPLSNLDANLREEMRFEIKALQKQTGITILYVTHDQEVALAISDRLAIMDRNGCIRQVGSPYEIYETPADMYVFKFMGISNFLSLEQREEGVYVRGSDMPLDYAFSGEEREKIRRREISVAGCRPSDIELSRNDTGIGGIVKRATLLGQIVDYRVGIGEQEIRVQQGLQEALQEGLLFSEGERCCLRFHDLKCFPSHTPEEVVQ